MLTNRRTLLGLLAALICAHPALAGPDSLSASVDLGPALGKDLTLERDGTAYTPVGRVVHLEFIDPRNRGEIGRILEDPRYFPANSEQAHFWIVSTMQVSPGESASEAASCDWSGTKTSATCVVDCDGGRYELVVDRAGAGEIRYLLRLTRVRIGAEQSDCSGEGVAYDLRSTRAGPVSLPVNFSQ